MLGDIMSPNHNPVEAVAKSTEEFQLLADVVQHLADDDQRLKYAEWLESQGDSRGPLLRDFVAAFAKNRPLPTIDSVSQAWADLTGLIIMVKLAEAKLRTFRDELL